jgi:hypothetical protein
MRVPGCIRMGAGVAISKWSQGGVMTSRFRASAKNGKSSDRGLGSQSSWCKVNSFNTWIISLSGG